MSKEQPGEKGPVTIYENKYGSRIVTRTVIGANGRKSQSREHLIADEPAVTNTTGTVDKTPGDIETPDVSRGNSTVVSRRAVLFTIVGAGLIGGVLGKCALDSK